MDSLLERHIKNKQLSHGYLLAGDFEISRRAALEAASALFGYPIAKLRRHPDFYHQAFESFGIKESQELKRKSSLRPMLGEKKIFILELFSFTIESANALLKIFEEPPEGTHFFVIVPSADAVIPTLRSRLIVIDSQPQQRASILEEEEFLKSLPGKRLDIVKKIGKDKNKAIEFLNGLEIILSKKTESSLSSRTVMEGNSSESEIPGFFALKQIQEARGFLSGRAPNVKMILEHIALILPVV